MLIAILTFLVWPVTGETIIKLRCKKNDNRFRFIKFEEQGPQFLLVKTNHKLYQVKHILSINDSVIVASNDRDTMEIKSSAIIQIKKSITRAEYAGYVVAGAAALGLLIGVPATWIEDGKDEVGNHVLGTLAIGSVAIPLIGIGRLFSRYNMNKWHIVSFSINKK